MLLRKLLLFILYFCICLKADNELNIYEKQGSYLPLNLEFINEYNQIKKIRDLIDNKATILSINYYDCPGLCSPQLHALASVLNRLDLKPFLDYKVITLSINTNDTAQKALEKKQSILKTINKAFPPQTWSFLTSKRQEDIDLFTSSVGFKYKKQIRNGIVDYIHPGVLIIISPKGKVVRYINGINYLAFDLKLALYEARDEKTRPTIAKTLLYCFAYDAKAKTYVFQAEKIIGSIILLLVIGFFIYLIKTGRRKDGK